jgi:hypothetical protein
VNLKDNIVNRVNALSSPLGDAMKAAQELMAPQLDAGTKGLGARPAAAAKKRLPHY